MAKLTTSFKNASAEDTRKKLYNALVNKNLSGFNTTGKKSVEERAIDLWKKSSPAAAKQLSDYATFISNGGKLAGEEAKALLNKAFYTFGQQKGSSPEATARAYLDQQVFKNMHRNEGYWDVEGNSPELWSDTFLAGQIKKLAGDLVKSGVEDTKAKRDQGKKLAAYENSAATAEGWKQLYQEEKNGTSDQWHNWLMADYLLGDRSEPFDFDAVDQKYAAMSDEEYYKEEERLRKQFEGLDWESLTNPQMPTYESKSPSLASALKAAKKEQDNRTTYQAFKALANAGGDELNLDEYYRKNIQGYDPQKQEENAQKYMTDLRYFINNANNDRFRVAGSLLGNNAQKTLQAMGETVVGALFGKNPTDSLFSMANAQMYDEDYSTLMGYYEKGYNYMTPEEIVIYNDLYQREPQLAQKFLDSIGEGLLERRNAVNYAVTEPVAQDAAWAVPSWLGARVANIGDAMMLPYKVMDAISGTDSPYSATNDFANLSQGVSGAQEAALGDVEWANALKLGDKNVLQHLYGAGSSAADNAMRLGLGGPTGALALAGLGTASGTLQELSARDDMSAAAKLTQAGLTGLLEVGTEKIGLDNLFKTDVASAGKYLLNTMGAEMGEEVLNAIGQDGLDYVMAQVFDHEAEIKSAGERGQEMLNTVVQTALSSLLMGAPGAVGIHQDNRAVGKQVKTQGDANAVVNIALEMKPGSQARTYAESIKGKLDKNGRYSLAQMGRLVKQLNQELDEEYSSVTNGVMDEAIAERMVELGSTPEKAQKNAPIVRKIAQGEQLTIQERMAADWDSSMDQVVREMSQETEPGELAEAKKAAAQREPVPGAAPADGDRVGQSWQRNMAINAVAAAGEVAEKQSRLASAIKTPVQRDVQQAASKASAKVKGKNNQAKNATVREVAYTTEQGENRGKLERFEMAEGEIKAVISAEGKETTVSVKDLTDEGGSGVATIIEYAGSANHNVSALEANAMLNTYEQTGGDVQRFISDFEAVYAAGFAGVEMPTTQLSEGVAKLAYDQAVEEGKTAEASRIERTKQIRQAAVGTTTWLGKVTSNEQVRGLGDEKALTKAMQGMTEGQRRTTEVIQQLAKKLHINMVLFESDAAHIGEIQNGSYDPTTHTIYIDVNSGAATAQGVKAQKRTDSLGHAMMQTLGHELTHYIESTSGEQYAKYKAAVKNALKENGQDFGVLVRERVQKSAQQGIKLTWAGAEAEVIADASELMLGNSRLVKNLDADLRTKVKGYVQGFMAKVKEIFGKLTNLHKESKALTQVIDGVRQYSQDIQDLWDAGLEEGAAGVAEAEQSGDATEMVEDDYAALLKDEGVSSMDELQEKLRRESMELNADSMQPVQYAIRDSEGRDLILAENELEENKKQVAQSIPVASIDGNEFSTGYYEKALQHYNEGNNVANNPVLGKVRIEETGIEHLMDFLSYRKTALIPAIKSVIEQGKIVFYEPTHKNNPWGTALIAAKVALDGKEYYMGVSVRHLARDDTRYYIHDAILVETEKGTTPIKNAGGNAGTARSGNPSIFSILLSMRKYNREFAENQAQYSLRDLPDGVTVRDYLRSMETTERMTETEVDLLNRYQMKLENLYAKEEEVAQQEELIRTATGDELTKAKNRYQIYRTQANRMARELARLERAEGFAGIMATGQKVVSEYLTGASGSVADATDALETEIKGLSTRLKTIGATVENTEQGQRNAFARGLFSQSELNQAAKQLKDSYQSRMSVKAISDRLALAYGEIYANDGAEGAKRFADAAKELAQDILISSKYRYRSETLTAIAEEVPTTSLTETDKVEIQNAGLTIAQYKRGVSPYVKVVEGASDLSSYVTNAANDGGQIARILGTDVEGDLAMALYNTIQAERQAESAGTFEGMSESESLGAVLVDVMSANLPLSGNGDAVEYLRKELKKYAGENAEIAEDIDKAIQSAKAATRKASTVWHQAVKAQEVARQAVEYYRALDEQRRLIELKEQKQELTAQLKSDAAKKIAEKLEEQRKEYRERQMDQNAMRALREKNEKTKKRIKTVVKRLDNLIRNETDQKHVPEGFKPVVEEMMRLFINDDSIEAFGNIDTEQGQKAVAKAYVAYERLREMDGEDVNQMSEFYDAEMEDTLKDLSILLTKLGAESNLVGTERLRTQAVFLEGIEEIVNNIYHISQNIGEIIINEKKASLAAITSSLRTQLEKKSNYRELAGAGQAVQGAAQATKYGNMTPVYFFRELGLDKLTDLANDLFTAEDKYGILFAKAQEEIRDIVNRHNYWAWINDADLTFKTKQGIETKKEEQHTITMSKSEAIAIWATWKREHQGDALVQTNHISNGGVVFGERQHGIWVETDTTAHKLSEPDMKTIGKYLTEEQKAFADDFVDFLTQLGQTYGNKTSMELYGVKKFKDGYYFPITVDRGQLAQKSDAGHGATDDSRIKHMPSSRKRINNASNAVVIGDFLDIGTRHVQQMLTYHCYAVPVENMNRVLNAAYNDDSDSRTTIRKMIGQKYGEEAINYLERFIADMNGGVKSDKVEKGFGKMVSLFKKSAVVNSLSVAIQQPTSIIRAMMEIDLKYFVPFVGRDANTQLSKEWEQLKEHSGVAVLKEIGGFDMTKSGNMAQALAGNMEDGFNNFQMMKLAFTIGAPKGQKIKTAGRQWDKAFGFLASKADQGAWAYMWRVCKAETHAMHPEMDINSDEFLNLAGDRFNEVMRLTQVYDSTMARSQNMRSDAQFMKMLTAFGAEGTLTANMLYDAIRSKNGKNISKAVGIYFASQIITAAVASLIKAGRDDDAEKTWAEKYLAAMGNSLGGWSGALNPLALLPGVRDIMSLLDGYDIERSDMTIVADLVKEAEKLMNGKYADNPWRAIENAGGVVANAFGIPLKNMMRDARSLYNTATGLLAPPRKSNAMVMAKDALDNFSLNHLWEPDTSVNAYYAKLYEATLKKDIQTQEDLKEYLGILGKDEKTIKSGIVKVVKAKYLDGDLSEAEAKKILIDNGWAKDQKDAFTKVDGWKETAENEGDDDYSHSVYNTVFEAIDKGNSAAAKAAIKELTDNGWGKDDVESRIRSYVRESYMGGTITPSKVRELYKQYCLPSDFDPSDENDWYWLFRELDWGKKNGGSTDGYSKYSDFYAAVESGTNLRKVISEYTNHGVEKKTLSSQITNQYKKTLVSLWESGKKGEFANLQARILTAYEALGYDREKKLKDIQKWLQKGN